MALVLDIIGFSKLFSQIITWILRSASVYIFNFLDGPWSSPSFSFLSCFCIIYSFRSLLIQFESGIFPWKYAIISALSEVLTISTPICELLSMYDTELSLLMSASRSSHKEPRSYCLWVIGDSQGVYVDSFSFMSSK